MKVFLLHLISLVAFRLVGEWSWFIAHPQNIIPHTLASIETSSCLVELDHLFFLYRLLCVMYKGVSFCACFVTIYKEKFLFPLSLCLKYYFYSQQNISLCIWTEIYLTKPFVEHLAVFWFVMLINKGESDRYHMSKTYSYRWATANCIRFFYHPRGRIEKLLK